MFNKFSIYDKSVFPTSDICMNNVTSYEFAVCGSNYNNEKDCKMNISYIFSTRYNFEQIRFVFHFFFVCMYMIKIPQFLKDLLFTVIR